MTQDEVIRMATEAGLLEPGYVHGNAVIAELARFAALVAAAEREVCAKLADAESNPDDPFAAVPQYLAGGYEAANHIAAAIRARTQEQLI